MKRSLLTGLWLELVKIKRKRLLLSCVAMLVILFLWYAMTISQQRKTTASFQALLFQLPILNAIFLPILVMIIAATISDLENQAQMWNQVLVRLSFRQVLRNKWWLGAVFITVICALELLALVALGRLYAYQSIPAGELVLFFFSTWIVSAFILTLGQILCLWTKSQFLPLVTGVVLSFLGLFSLYLPWWMASFIPSSYYGLLSTVSISWQETSRKITFATQPYLVGHALALIICGIVIYALGAKQLSQREGD